MRKKIFFIFILTIAGIVAGFLLYRNDSSQSNDTEEISDFYDIEINNIKLTGIEGNFSIHDGKIYKNGIEQHRKSDEFMRAYKLGLFFQTTKENPVLFDPNLEYERFDESVNRLRKQNEIFSAEAGLGYAHPIEFLERFSTASAFFRIFEAEITEENAQKMFFLMKEAYVAYEKDVERIGKIFKEAALSERKSDLYFLGMETISNMNIISEDFEKMEKNVSFLSEKIKSKGKCLNNGECQRLISQSALPVFNKKETEELPAILPLEEIASDVEVEGGPYLIHSTCWRNRNSNLMYAGKKCSSLEDGNCLNYPILSDGDYWVKTLEEIENERAFVQMGIERKRHSASAPYGCMDLTYASKIQIINSVFLQYKNKRLFDEKIFQVQSSDAQQKINELWQEGNKFEQAFFDSQFPSDEAFESLGKYYSYTYEFLAKENLLDADIRNEFLTRANIFQGKIKSFNLILNRTNYHFASHLKSVIERAELAENKNIFFTYNVFATRTNYSITFLNFSPFVWQIEDKPQYFMIKDNLYKGIDKNTHVITHNDAVQLYGKDKILQWDLKIRDERILRDKYE